MDKKDKAEHEQLQDASEVDITPLDQPEDTPIRLTPGYHLIRWHAAPFQDQYCQLTAPIGIGDNCDLATDQLPQQMQGSVQLILLQMSIAALNIDQQSTLIVAVQSAFDSLQASQAVQPGELHLGPNGNGKPLVATLHFDFESPLGLDQPYIFDGRPCQQLCVVPWSSLLSHNIAPSAPQQWLALAYITSSWSYATPDGHIIAQGQPIDAGGAAVKPYPDLLRMQWDGTSWNVEPLIGADQAPAIDVNTGVPQPSVPIFMAHILNDPACVAARDLLSQDVLIQPQQRFVSGPNPAADCLVAATSVANTAGLPASSPVLYLEHLGVLLAVNPAAHKLEPYLPVADASEQALAQQLEIYPGQMVSTP